MNSCIQIHPDDTVAVALAPITAGEEFCGVVAQTDIPQGHKMALKSMAENDQVVKYGFSIGHATGSVAPGQWVHTHNMKTNLSGEIDYTYNPKLKKRLTAYAATYPDLCRLTEDDENGGLRFEIDKRRISIRLTAPYSEERRNAAKKRGKESGFGKG